MTDSAREGRLTTAFVKLADTLVHDYDMIDLLESLVRECVLLLDTDAGGLMIADPSKDQMQLVVSTSDEVGLVDDSLRAGEGPYIECFTSGKPVSVADIENEAERWPRFREHALAGGFRSIHVFPLRLRETVIGAMNLFSTTTGNLSEKDRAIGQALADVATIGVLQERAVSDSNVLSEQLQRALDSRVVIEQAKGVIARSSRITMDEAFSVLRNYARENRRRVSDVAVEVGNFTLDLPLTRFHNP